jgi:hypothetical protein
MVEDVDGRLASLLGQVVQRAVHVSPGDGLCPAEFLECRPVERS